MKNKRALQQELGLAQNDKKMMIGVVSRLTDQKGFDLIAYIMELVPFTLLIIIDTLGISYRIQHFLGIVIGKADRQQNHRAPLQEPFVQYRGGAGDGLL